MRKASKGTVKVLKERNTHIKRSPCNDGDIFAKDMPCVFMAFCFKTKSFLEVVSLEINITFFLNSNWQFLSRVLSFT